jgi:DNA invertase Pin-like site-specific DNA recombinase
MQKPEIARICCVFLRFFVFNLLWIRYSDNCSKFYKHSFDIFRLGRRNRISILYIIGLRGKRNLMAILVADLVLAIASYFAESERDAIRLRQVEGIAAAKAKGVKFGRTPMKKPVEFPAVCAEWRNSSFSAREAGKRLGVLHCTFLKWAKHVESECTLIFPYSK